MQTQRSNLGQSKSETLDPSGSECFGAATLTKLLANYCRNSGIKTAIRVGIVGERRCMDFFLLCSNFFPPFLSLFENPVSDSNNIVFAKQNLRLS